MEPRTKRGDGEERTVEPKSKTEGKVEPKLKTEDKGEKLELSDEEAELELELDNG